VFFVADTLVWSIRKLQSRQTMSTQLGLLYDLQIAIRVISQVPFVPLFMPNPEAGYASTLKLNTLERCLLAGSSSDSGHRRVSYRPATHQP
jgi:hypothetical protein